jgi:hypothetical protein
MNRTILWLALIFTASTIAQAGQDEIRKTMKFADSRKPNDLIVDNVSGGIKVVGYDGDEIQLVVKRFIDARSEKKALQAKEEVRLDMKEEADHIELYVDGPFRCEDGSINYRGWRHYGYEVTMDFELTVPRSTNLYLKTVNNGEIKVDKIKGDFDIENVNGGIVMRELSGSGRAYALNGEVNIEFTENPVEDCFFGSLNGDVTVEFLPNLSADLRLKIFNGSVFTDFEVTGLPQRSPTSKRKNGKFIYQADKSFGARVGSGGPEIEFDGFNGNIYIKERTDR